MTTRRDFIKTTAIGGAALTGGLYIPQDLGKLLAPPSANLYALSHDLLKQWAAGLLALQVTDQSRTDDYGGIWCPADKAVHGRVGDSIYPFFYLADKTNDHRYMDASVLLYRWMDRRVSQPDGSWLNEPVKGSWKGTTVFAAIALAEAVKKHGHLMDTQFKAEVTARLKKAGDYIHDNFTVDYGNINYPVTASYGLTLLGEILDEPKFTTKGRDLAHQGISYITAQDKLLYGEGALNDLTKKGCHAIDLGYNVEESLPALVLYGLLTNDEEVLGAVTQSMQTHLEFMLPDGGWDNSWGTRNYKWTYWGSRTSDGCQTAYALMAHRDKRFYKAALLNTQLMQQLTVNGLLQGGPHYAAHGVTPCVHHTFSHIKALANVLEYGDAQTKFDVQHIALPREESYSHRFFSDIQTSLIAKGKFRATATGYDMEYKKDKNGHATGGALTMLWHPATGPILCGSMNAYQLYEAGNMQPDTDPLSMPLTPRIELKLDGTTYMNISDLNATVEVVNDGASVTVKTQSNLVDQNQQNPPAGPVNCRVTYTFTAEHARLGFDLDQTGYDKQVKIIVPVIAKSTQVVKTVSAREVSIPRKSAMVTVSCDQLIQQLPTTGGRVFNYVPGFEAVPLCVVHNKAVITIKVT